MTGTVQTMTAVPAAGTESILAGILAEVMRAEQVPAGGHFFDDLGADSLVMAKFCARVRKREDLPSFSMKDIYGHPTIRSLAEAFAKRLRTRRRPGLDLAAGPTEDPAASRPGSGRPGCGGDGQHAGIRHVRSAAVAVFPGYAWVAALVGARAYEWIRPAPAWPPSTFGRSCSAGPAFVVVCTLPILAKWVLIGRWKPGKSGSGAWAMSGSGSSRRWSGRTRWPC